MRGYGLGSTWILIFERCSLEDIIASRRRKLLKTSAGTTVRLSSIGVWGSRGPRGGDSGRSILAPGAPSEAEITLATLPPPIDP
jgi:hypothetical protein